MASLTKKREGADYVQNPASGYIGFSAKTGKFFRYFPAQVENGTVTKPAEKVDLKNARFMIVAANFMKVSGGKPDRRNRDQFVGVSSRLHAMDRGMKWDQLISVWVGQGSRTPTYYGTWSEIKEGVDSKGGKYTEVLFVIAADWPEELLTLELTGYSITQLGNAIKAQYGTDYKDNLLNEATVLFCDHTEPFEIDERTFYKPVFFVEPLNQKKKGAEQMLARMIEFSNKVDNYADSLEASQRSGETNQEQNGQEAGSKEQTTQAASQPAKEPTLADRSSSNPATSDAEAGFPDDLPF